MVELRAVAFSAVTFFLFQAQASALEKISAPADHVRSALGEMNALLAQNPAVAPGWRAYLRLDALQAELRNGSDASPKAVAAIRDQLKAPLPELHRSEIQRLRTAVDRWAKSLDQSHLNPYWAEAAKEAAAFTPVTPQQLSAARAKSIAAVQTLQNRLHAVGAPAGPAWEQRLKLQALSQKLKNNRGPLLDASTSDMWSESLGVWNEPALVAAYSALQKDDQLRIAAENKETSAIFQQRLADLQTVVNDFSHVPAVEHYAKMGQLVHELEARGQAPKLTAVLRQEHSRPNMILKASAAFIEHQTKANLAEEFPVNDVILGTPVEGAGQLRGEAYLRLVPYESAAGFDLHLEADMTSDTTSSSRGVDVQTKGAARLSGRKRMLFDGHGVRFYPSQVNADLDVSLVNINGGPIRRRLAVSVFEQQREQARLESKSRAEERVAERMDQGLNEVQGRLAQGPAKRYMEPLFVRQPGIVRHWRTTTDMLEGRFWSADPFEFASPTPPPTAATARGVTMQLHQSFLERMLRKQLAGRTLNQEQMAAESDTWFMRGKEERPEHSGPNWHVSFADSLPAKVRITGNEVRIVMFCTQFASEKGEFPGQQVSLTYGVQCRDDKLILARHGDVGIMPIDYVDGTEIHFSGRQQVLRRIMQRSFEKQFPAEIALAGFEPSAGNGLKEAMGFNRATADEGWLSLVMEPRGQTANVAKAQAGTTHQ